jgi:C_GCAxxG_C_C family probable redox protein
MKMKSNGTVTQLDSSVKQASIDRRTFLAKSVGYTTALTMFSLSGATGSAFASQAGKTDEEIFRELDEKADNYYQMYKTCSQAPFAALNDQFGMKADRMIGALRPFAGGIVGKGETCGAASSALLAIGIYFEPANQNDTKKPGASMAYAKQFFERFTDEFDHSRCREVIKHQYGRYYNWNDPQELNLYKEAFASTNGSKRIEVVKTAVRIAADIILKKS